MDLRTAVSLLPTPAARDWKSGESNLMDRNARPLNEVVVNLLPTPSASFPGTTANFRPDGTPYNEGYGPTLPTPTASDGERKSSTYGRGNPTLTGAITHPPSAAGSTSSDAPPPGPPTLWDD
jgi:DNA (cytosine-5)-methyltransferase 1